MKNFKIYVGTYEKYNNGSIFGKWLNINDYKDIDELHKAMSVLHSDEDDPEYMLQDFECPKILEELGLISECHIDENIYDIIESLESSHLGFDIMEAYVSCFGKDDNIDVLIENANDAFAGQSESDVDFVYDMLEDCGDVPENIPSYIYIDWEKTAECVMQDYCEHNGYYFRNC